MNINEARVLNMLIGRQRKRDELLEVVGVKERQLANIIENLKAAGYASTTDSAIMLAETSKAAVLREVAQHTDIEKLLGGSNETVFTNVKECKTIAGLERKTGLSKATIYRAILDLQAFGAIVKKDGILLINDAHESLTTFANILRIEADRIEAGGAKIIYNDGAIVLRKIIASKDTKGVIVKGMTTGFSLFSEYGVEYNPIYNYYCEQRDYLDIQDVLIHAVYSSIDSKNSMELLMCIVFYTMHKNKMDVSQLRKKSQRMGIVEIWLDIEAYIRRGELKNPKLFLPWEEFLSKATLYDVPKENFTLPSPSNVFSSVNDALDNPMTIYMLGGENMRIKLLKTSTKDCDVAVKNRRDFEVMSSILTDIGYKRIGSEEFGDEDRRINPMCIFTHKHHSRIDLFSKIIADKLSLSQSMMERADLLDYGKLKVKMLRNEDVFLLKSVAGREGDIQDMVALVKGSPNTPSKFQHGSFDWKLVWREILEQERTPHADEISIIAFEQIAYVNEHPDIKVPIIDKLRRHTIGLLVERILRGGSAPMTEIVKKLVGGDFTETRIRNKCDTMEKAGIIEKIKRGGTVNLRLLKDVSFPGQDSEINEQNLGEYIGWRFSMKSDLDVSLFEEVTEELRDANFNTIGEIDTAVRRSLVAYEAYVKNEIPEKRISGIDAIRICMGICYKKLGKNHSKPYFINNFNKYHKMIRDPAHDSPHQM